jgi:hypothetical protein
MNNEKYRINMYRKTFFFSILTISFYVLFRLSILDYWSDYSFSDSITYEGIVEIICLFFFIFGFMTIHSFKKKL